MSWTRKIPEPPPTGSEWYWYWDPKEKEPWITEIYKGCWKFYTYEGLWWEEPVKRPSESPNFKNKTKVKEQKKERKVCKNPQQEILSALESMPKESKPKRGRGLL